MALMAQNSSYTANYEAKDLNADTAAVRYAGQTLYGIDTSNVWREIWSANTQVYPGTAVQSLAANKGSYGAFYTHLEGMTGDNNNSTVVYIPVDVTGFHTMTIGCNCYTQQHSGSWTGIWLAAPSQWVTNIVCYPYYTIAGTNEANEMRYATCMHRVNNGGAFTSLTWDVSALSGVYYLAAGCYCNNSASLAHAQIDTVVLV